MPVRTPNLMALSAFTAALVLTAAGCGKSTSPSGTPVTHETAPRRTAYPLTIDNCGQKVTFTRPPSRVLILNGTSVAEVESFVMLGLTGSILANAQHYGVSDDPSMVTAIKALPTRGLTMNKNFDVPAEQVLAAKPDLVVSTWSGGFDARSGFATREQLAAAGIRSLVNPVNCANGKPNASPAEKEALRHASIESSFQFMTLLGRIFDVQVKAAQIVAGLRARVRAVQARTAGAPPRKVLIAYPGMSMMNANGLPAVMTGGIYDDVIKAAGGQNSFAGRGEDTTRTLNAEQLAAAQVDVLAVGVFTPDEKPAEEARRLFAAYPQWQASKTGTYAIVSDGVYLGPMNAWAVEKLAKVIHPNG
ncbi:ABC transporter substrate-binding protein [Actinoallomurus rhizosphaericola]|uniref:ABC transporter substrate-binding protein n=1 Tax=Actinoallomurus rhizosphaericola TaxID=2952536 RepID=UPI00209370C2|nr:ABC transporter substrate-binding protein [Actinoallomurus rhizosphaericola]MCO6000102.1 ABC transporter substrate-binding protein [Actinoallomurus rhizosphaericola]